MFLKVKQKLSEKRKKKIKKNKKKEKKPQQTIYIKISTNSSRILSDSLQKRVATPLKSSLTFAY